MYFSDSKSQLINRICNIVKMLLISNFTKHKFKKSQYNIKTQ